MDALSSNPSSSRISTLSNSATSSQVNVEKDKVQEKPLASENLSSADSIHVSKPAQEMGLNSSSINMDKVEALKNAIANGTYKINPSNIAKQLLDQAF